MEKTKKAAIEDACPLPPDTPSLVFVSASSKTRGPVFTFRRVYITASLFLIMLIPTVLLFNGDVGVRSILVGEVLSVEYKNEPYPHTIVLFAAKPLKDDMGILPDADVKSIELNGDLRNIFQTGSYYNVTYEKRAMALYPDLRSVDVQLPITRQLIVTSVGLGINIEERARLLTFYTSIQQLGETLYFKGSYLSLFEIGGSYNITYVGGYAHTLLRYQKLAKPYAFWIRTCLLTNYVSTIDIMRLVPGNETIVGIDVDGIACSEFKPVSPAEFVYTEITFKVSQHLESDQFYTVSLRMEGGIVKSFEMRGDYGSGDILA